MVKKSQHKGRNMYYDRSSLHGDRGNKEKLTKNNMHEPLGQFGQ